MRVCCIFNIAPTYRRAIFTLLDNDDDIDVDFLVGEHSVGGIAVMNSHTLSGFRGYLRNIYKPGGKLVWQRRAIRKAFDRRYDAYILTGNPGIRSNWIISVLARIMGRKVILWTHGLYGNESHGELRRNMLYMRLANRLLVYGERAARLLVAQGFDADRIDVIYNSLEYDCHIELRSKIGDNSFIRNYFGNRLPVMSFVGRLSSEKRIDMAIEALTRLDINLILVGDGARRDELERQAEMLGVQDRVWFYGECYDEQMIAAILYHSALCLSPGNVGLTAIHALSFGTPVVTHDDAAAQMPESEAIIPDVTGSLFARDDMPQMIRAIEMWIDQNPTQREATRQSCYRIIDTKYNPHRQIEIIREALTK